MRDAQNAGATGEVDERHTEYRRHTGEMETHRRHR